jgi:hypothetical protein
MMAKTGQLLVDGRVTAIDAEGITFQITGESGTPLPKPLTRRLTLKGKRDP